MLNFDKVYNKHGEQFIFSILDQWERDYCIKHITTLSLEERWNYFIRATEHNTLCAAA